MAKSLNGRLGLPILIKSTRMLVVVQVDKDKDKIHKVNGGELIIKSSLSSLGFHHPRAITDSRWANLDIRLRGPIGLEMSKIVAISDWLLLSESKRVEPASMVKISPNLRTWHSLTG